MLRITPPQDASDRRVKVYNFIEAIRTFPTNFTKEEYKSIMSKVNPKLYTKLRETFLVLNDDLEKVNSSSRGKVAADGGNPTTGSNQTALGSRSNKRPSESPRSSGSKTSRT